MIMSISIFLSPEDVEAYNGQQGDYWDAQKDMAFAFLGAVSMVMILQSKKVSKPQVPKHKSQIPNPSKKSWESYH